VNAFGTPLFHQQVALQHHPLGSTFTRSLHSVVSSLPTRGDVVGYEEKSPDVMGHLKQGYPRFLRHHLVVALSAAIAARQGWGDAFVCPVASEETARRLRAYAGKAVGTYEDEWLTAVAFKPRTLTADRAGAFLQHTGTLISSRMAEDWLVANGQIEAVAPELQAAGDADRMILDALRPWLATATGELLTVTCGGANAFWAAHEAINELQAERGRDVWLQLGWLYVDTGIVLDRFASGEGPHKWVTAHCLDEVEAYLAGNGARVAGMVCETPSNPLLETADVPRLSELAQRHGAKLVIDPTVASVLNVDVLPYADVVVCSLTKYAGRLRRGKFRPRRRRCAGAARARHRNAVVCAGCRAPGAGDRRHAGVHRPRQCVGHRAGGLPGATILRGPSAASIAGQ
jgi:cystathionine gamma-synthase